MFAEAGSVIYGLAAATVASIGAGAVALLGLIAPVWIGIALGAASAAISIIAIIMAVQADERSRANATLLNEFKQSVSSQAAEVEATLKHGQ